MIVALFLEYKRSDVHKTPGWWPRRLYSNTLPWNSRRGTPSIYSNVEMRGLTTKEKFCNNISCKNMFLVANRTHINVKYALRLQFRHHFCCLYVKLGGANPNPNPETFC